MEIHGNREKRIAESGQRIGCGEEKMESLRKNDYFLHRILFSNLYTLFSSLLLMA